jgi:hypothetical protein
MAPMNTRHTIIWCCDAAIFVALGLIIRQEYFVSVYSDSYDKKSKNLKIICFTAASIAWFIMAIAQAGT